MSAESAVTALPRRALDESSITAAADNTNQRLKPELVDVSEETQFLRIFSENALRTKPLDIASVGRTNTGRDTRPIDGFCASLEVQNFLRRFCRDELITQLRTAAEARNAAQPDKKKHINVNHIPLMDGLSIPGGSAARITDALKDLGRNVYRVIRPTEIWDAVSGKINQLASSSAPQPEMTDEQIEARQLRPSTLEAL